MDIKFPLQVLYDWFGALTSYDKDEILQKLVKIREPREWTSFIDGIFYAAGYDTDDFEHDAYIDQIYFIMKLKEIKKKERIKNVVEVLDAYDLELEDVVKYYGRKLQED